MSGQGQLLYLSHLERERLRRHAASSPAVQQLVAAEQRTSVDAAMLVLLSPLATRRQLAAGILLGGLFVQAAYLGLVRCALCGDRGCPGCGA